MQWCPSRTPRRQQAFLYYLQQAFTVNKRLINSLQRPLNYSSRLQREQLERTPLDPQHQGDQPGLLVSPGAPPDSLQPVPGGPVGSNLPGASSQILIPVCQGGPGREPRVASDFWVPQPTEHGLLEVEKAEEAWRSLWGSAAGQAGQDLCPTNCGELLLPSGRLEPWLCGPQRGLLPGRRGGRLSPSGSHSPLQLPGVAQVTGQSLEGLGRRPGPLSTLSPAQGPHG